MFYYYNFSELYISCRVLLAKLACACQVIEGLACTEWGTLLARVLLV